MAMLEANYLGERLRLARVLHGYSQSELGEIVGVTHGFVSQVEAGQKSPSEENLRALAAALKVDTSFFQRPTRSEVREDECFFRRRKTTAVSVRSRVLAHGTMFLELLSYLEQKVALPPYSVPCIRAREPSEIEKAAENCRMRWGLSVDRPVKSVIRALECAGVVVVRFPASAVKVDAFSRAGARGIVVLNTDKGSTSRARFDLAHECGHLVLHAGQSVDGDGSLESEADRFASAFLMPRAGFVREFPSRSSVRLEDLIPLKARWRCSFAAMIRRAFDLKLIDGLAYQRAFKMLYSRGMAKGETYEPPDEPPETVALAIGLLNKTTGRGIDEIALELGWTTDMLRQIVPDAIPSEQVESKDAREGKIVSLDAFRAAQKLSGK